MLWSPNAPACPNSRFGSCKNLKQSYIDSTPDVHPRFSWGGMAILIKDLTLIASKLSFQMMAFLHKKSGMAIENKNDNEIGPCHYDGAVDKNASYFFVGKS